MRDLKSILAKFEEIVSPNFCNSLALESQFVQRSTSQLKGYEFAQSMMIPNASLEAETLNSLARRMKKINLECNLSAPALAQRMNSKNAKAFMKACFERVLKEVVKCEFFDVTDLSYLSGFNRILIQDSTVMELHEKLSPHFQGVGGSASKSSVKVDYIFDYLSEKLVDIDFFSGNQPDQSLAKRLIPMLEMGDLVIRDLGYYSLEQIKEIEQSESYYISRFKVDVNVYESKDAKKPLDLAKFIEKNIYQGMLDIQVFIGKEKHPTRLVACLMDEETINKKQRVANKTAARRGLKVSKQKRTLLKYAIFITNIPSNMLSATLITVLYRARWRIELIFKEWKSCLKLHMFKGYNKERFLCLLYGRLIMILLIGAMSPILMKCALKLGRELSCFKFIKYLIADHEFPKALQEGKCSQFVDELYENVPRRLCMDKRKRSSLRSNIRQGNGYNNHLKSNELKNKAA